MKTISRTISPSVFNRRLSLGPHCLISPGCRLHTNSSILKPSSENASRPGLARAVASGGVQDGIATDIAPLSMMPTSLLLRSWFITSILASPRIVKLGLPIMTIIANSKSRFLNPDRNPLLRVVIRKFIYDHFAAGINSKEVMKTIDQLKNMGFKGVILGYAKEVNVTGGDTNFSDELGNPSTSTIESWKEGILQTLRMIDKGDVLAVKYSGAGPSTLKALYKKTKPPTKMWEAMIEICDAAVSQNTRVWIDAEQQDLQSTIDQWTIELMRKYNRGGKAVLYTTMQAYLKHTEANILQHLKLAQEEGWILAIKLVRGAYIATEQRNLIHDTIEDTHNAYDRIATQLMSQSFPGLASNKPFPSVALFLATHNNDSITKLYEIQRSLSLDNRLNVEVSYAQLQGMADDISCKLLQAGNRAGSDGTSETLAPRVFKCLVYGSTQECLQFLLRRIKENADALGRTGYWAAEFRREIWRRIRSAPSSFKH